MGIIKEINKIKTKKQFCKWHLKNVLPKKQIKTIYTFNLPPRFGGDILQPKNLMSCQVVL